MLICLVEFQHCLHRYVLNRKMMITKGIRTIWEEDSPEPLVDLAVRCLLSNPSTLFYAIDITRTNSGGSIDSVTDSPSRTRKGPWDIVEHEDRISEKGEFNL